MQSPLQDNCISKSLFFKPEAELYSQWPERGTRPVIDDFSDDKVEEPTIQQLCLIFTVLSNSPWPVPFSSFRAMKQPPQHLLTQARFCARSFCSKLKLRRWLKMPLAQSHTEGTLGSKNFALILIPTTQNHHFSRTDVCQEPSNWGTEHSSKSHSKESLYKERFINLPTCLKRRACTKYFPGLEYPASSQHGCNVLS